MSPEYNPLAFQFHIYRDHAPDGYDGTWSKGWTISIRWRGYGTSLEFSLWRYLGRGEGE